MGNLTFSKTFVDGVALPASDLNTLQSDVSGYINARNGASTAWDGLKSTSSSVVPGVFDNSTGTQNILECKDNGGTVFSVADGGTVSITGSLLVNGSTMAGSALDGWIPASETWTYASASTFTIVGDKTGTYNKGDRIKLTNSTLKYFVVSSVSYGGGNTTVTVFGGNTYSLVNSAITLPYYSKVPAPNGYPSSFQWTSTMGGWTTTTTTTQLAVYGQMCYFFYDVTGTSNATNATLSLPIAVVLTGTSMQQKIAFARDNGTAIDTGIAQANAGTTLNLWRTAATITWTSSGTKSMIGVFMYEF